MQAQNDLMALLARKEISIVSTEDEIKIIAKKKLTLNGGGVISDLMQMRLNLLLQANIARKQDITGVRKALLKKSKCLYFL